MRWGRPPRRTHIFGYEKNLVKLRRRMQLFSDSCPGSNTDLRVFVFFLNLYFPLFRGLPPADEDRPAASPPCAVVRDVSPAECFDEVLALPGCLALTWSCLIAAQPCDSPRLYPMADMLFFGSEVTMHCDMEGGPLFPLPCSIIPALHQNSIWPCSFSPFIAIPYSLSHFCRPSGERLLPTELIIEITQRAIAFGLPVAWPSTAV